HLAHGHARRFVEIGVDAHGDEMRRRLRARPLYEFALVKLNATEPRSDLSKAPPLISPSPCTAWPSPIKRSALGTWPAQVSRATPIVCTSAPLLRPCDGSD